MSEPIKLTPSRTINYHEVVNAMSRRSEVYGDKCQLWADAWSKVYSYCELTAEIRDDLPGGELILRIVKIDGEVLWELRETKGDLSLEVTREDGGVAVTKIVKLQK